MTRRLLDRPEIVAHDVVTRALHQVTEDGLGDMEWAAPLEALTRSLDTETHLTVSGRRRTRRQLVDLLVARSSNRREPPVATDLVITGLDDGAVEALTHALGGGTNARPRFETSFVSRRFEEQWHVPAYAEWCSGEQLDALISSIVGESPVIGGVDFAEHLPAVRATAPGAVIVVVESDIDSFTGVHSKRSASARRRYSSDVDDAKVGRYWRWRLRSIAERLADDAPDIVVRAEDVIADPITTARKLPKPTGERPGTGEPDGPNRVFGLQRGVSVSSSAQFGRPA